MPISGKMESTVSCFLSPPSSVWASLTEQARARLTTVASLGDSQILQINAECELFKQTSSVSEDIGSKAP